MTENEAIEVLNNFDMQVSAKADGAYQSTIGEMACKVAIKALEEIQQYREIGTIEQLKVMKQEFAEALSDWRQYRKIGTVEECREAREKQKPEKMDEGDLCPVCGCCVVNDDGIKGNYCPNCGKRIE